MFNPSTAIMGQVLLQLFILPLLIRSGFAMTYGVFQEFYVKTNAFHGNSSDLGVVGTTLNGVVYLSMPFLFAAFNRQWARYRRTTAICGAILASASFLISSFSKNVWQLVMTQGVLAALGSAMIYSTTTLSLDEHFSSTNRALAYGAVLSAKNITGSACPFLMQWLLYKFGFATTMRIWAVITAATGMFAVLTMSFHGPGTPSATIYRPRRTPRDFLHHGTFWIYSIAIMLQSSGYGITQTYLSTYADSVTSLSTTMTTLLLTLFNAPGIISSLFFGFISDNRHLSLSATSTTFVSAIASGLAAFLLWGLANPTANSISLLVLFSVIYGFFAGGYSATWGGIIKEMEKEAADRNEAIDTGMVYGLLNGARGIGYVSGGLAGVKLLNAGKETSLGRFGYGTQYGPLIVFVGLSTSLGGWSIILKCRKLLRWA
jgi:MFS family permease